MYSGSIYNSRINTVHVPKTVKYLEYIGYILLLFIVIPMHIHNPSIDEHLFQEYIAKFNKSYANKETYNRRLHAFGLSLKTIEDLNKNKTNISAQYGLTKYSDLLPEEFVKLRLLPSLSSYIEKDFRVQQKNGSRYKRTMNLRIKVPQTIDWRKKNAVTKVQNQGSCGACWAFSAIGVIESMYAIKTGKLVKFSIQEMIDCSKYDEGCDGGDIYSLLRWMKTFNVTVVKDEVYPLSLSKGTCKGNFSSSSSEGIRLKAFDCGSYIDSEDLILALLALNGPVAVAINAQSWQNYVGGTIQYHCSDDPLSINHAVQIVGYDLTATVPYYIVKNSWGDEFGMDGYLQIAVGENLCGLAYEVCAIQLL